MALTSLGLGEEPDRRPESGHNNLWHHYRNTDRCIVLIHGLGDDSRDCWYDAPSKSYWPDRLLRCPALQDYSIFLGGYYTSKISSGSYGVADCAGRLLDNLSRAA